MASDPDPDLVQSLKRLPDTPESIDRPAKRSKPRLDTHKQRRHQNAFIDSTWGQKYFFSGAGDGSSVPQDPELDFEDDADAMAYLSSVRAQANTIPHLLIAPKHGPQLPRDHPRPRRADDGDGNDEYDEDASAHPSLYDDGTGDFRGYYEDGAYTAAPLSPELDDTAVDRASAVANAYYAELKASFLALRARLRKNPPPSIVASLPKDNSPHVGSFGPNSSTFQVWNHRLLTTDPHPAQVAALDGSATLRVLRVLMGGRFLRLGDALHIRTSRWLWALLAHLPDAGEMSHVDIGWVRDLGRRAVLMTRSLAEMAALREQMETGAVNVDLGVHEGVDDSEDDEYPVQDMASDDIVEDEDGENGGESRRDAPSEKDAPTASQHETENNTEDKDSDSSDNDVEMEDGELTDHDSPNDPPSNHKESDLEAAKARLLARINSSPKPSPSPTQNPQEDPHADALSEIDSEIDSEQTIHARINMRATLNMILTVAGEFYGQRDLLEFRDPFAGMGEFSEADADFDYEDEAEEGEYQGEEDEYNDDVRDAENRDESSQEDGECEE